MSALLLETILGQHIYQLGDGSFSFHGGMNVDADGSPNAYNPENTGLDDLRNAKASDGSWCGIVTNPNGSAVIQGPSDPFPGYFVSQTSLRLIDPATGKPFPATSPSAYVDAEVVPYAVCPGILARKARGIVLGCLVHVLNTQTNLMVPAVCADTGPSDQLGEGSISLAVAHGVPADPRTGGTNSPKFLWTFFPGVAAPGYQLQRMG